MFCTECVIKTYNTVNSDCFVETCGFLYGVHESFLINNVQIVQSPIYSYSLALMSGTLYSLLSTVVASILPETVRFIVPLAMFMKVGYTQMK